MVRCEASFQTTFEPFGFLVLIGLPYDHEPMMRYDRSELGHIDAGLPRISLWCWEIVLSWQYIFVDTTCSRCSYTSHGVTWTFVRRGRNSHGIPSLMRYGRSELGHV